MVQNAIQLEFHEINLQFPPLVDPEDGGETIAEQFEAFHAANPHVYRALRALALNYKRAGNDRAGMKMLYENLRYLSGVETQGDPYKLNNNYTALYARRLMEHEPELEGFFELRERRAN
jgi:hypothetical protein